MDKPWMVFNIGCIECGVSSDVVGLFATEKEANKVADACREIFDWREGGQNGFEVYDLSAPRSDEYEQTIIHALEDV